MIIDLEMHLSMPQKDQKERFESGKITERYWGEDGEIHFHTSQEATRVDRFLQFMDEAGIDMAVLSFQQHDLEQVKKWHDHCARVVNEHPVRFAGFASISPLGGKPAFEELERAVTELGMKGVHIFTENDGHQLDSREMWPFYEKVSELNIPVDIHITNSPPGFDSLHAPYALYYVAARELHMIASVFRVCFGGVLEDFPELKLIMNHFGGGVSSIIDRFDAYTGYADHPGWSGFYRGKRLTSKPFREYFDKLYFNMAGREASIATVKCALTNISPRKLVFGTDWPLNYDYNPQGVRRYIEEIRTLDLPEDDIEAMLGGNAARLLNL
jgi:predicted TIM-barrel fold metal-dependent hydrolase